MIVDSHCHLNLIDLGEFNNDLNEVLKQAHHQGVEHFLCVCVDLEDYPQLEKIAQHHEHVSISVGVHPNSVMKAPVTTKMLCDLANNPKCIAIGETGLDYFRTEGFIEQEAQRQQFREHIQAAIACQKPLIIHTRQAIEDTLQVMKEEHTEQIGGVMHCFSEDLVSALRSIELNFYISFSGIVTFKNATTVHQVAKEIPLDRILIETDSPYLSPVPFRGKQNHPALVKFTAEYIAQLRGIEYEELARATTENFYRCFRLNR